MAALVYDKDNVRTVSAESHEQSNGVLGETVEAGQSISQLTSDNKWYLTDGITGTGPATPFQAVALQNGILDQNIALQTGGTIYLGVDTDEGMIYVVSQTPGGIENAVEALAVSSLNVDMIGYGDDLGNLVIKKVSTGYVIY